MKSEAYDKLPEADKKRIREAMDRVWGRPEVIEARERTLKAHADLRDTIRVSLEKTDPEVAVLLKKVEPDQGFDPRQLPPMPAVDSAEFAPAVTLRLEMDLLMFVKPDRKDATKLFHQRLMGKPEVQAALKQVQESRGEERIQAAQKLRQTYREAAYHEFQSIRSRPPSEGPKPEPK
jgi:TRAP-type C4-dicarboxylate transport system substrate-binding protein